MRKYITAGKDPSLFCFVLFAWMISLVWFHPRVFKLYTTVEGGFSRIALTLAILLLGLVWLNGFYNIGIVLFASLYRRQNKSPEYHTSRVPSKEPPVAVLYLTCNDFVEAAAYSCVNQNYTHFTVYILDDSTDKGIQERIDHFADKYADRVRVVRRPNRQGFKAGNLNYALSNFATSEPFFAISDADETLPSDFLKRVVPILIDDEQCGFVQTNHRCNPYASNSFRETQGIGIDIHWRWYQPLRNKYGFVMLLGHGAVLRRECWEIIGGFPEIVSEDLAYAIRLLDQGWYGRFAEDITCYEEFPETVRAFRIRHMKWTRGTCEILVTEAKRIIFSRKIPLIEKLDILLSTTNLLLSVLLLFAFFLLSFVPSIFNDVDATNVVYHFDFFLINLLILFAPSFCFVLELASRPFHLFRFLCYSSFLYGGLGPLSAIGVVAYIITRRATFFATGDRVVPLGKNGLHIPTTSWYSRIKNYFQSLLLLSHPDHSAVGCLEMLTGLLMICSSFFAMPSTLFGLGIAFVLLPIAHRVGWENTIIQHLVFLPFTLISLGLLWFGVLSLSTFSPLDTLLSNTTKVAMNYLGQVWR